MSRNHALLHLENGKLKLCPVSMKAYIIVKLVTTCGLCIKTDGICAKWKNYFLGVKYVLHSISELPIHWSRPREMHIRE